MGAGLALSPIHNQWLTQLFTNSKGETLFFLPAFGYLLLIMGSGLFLLNNWQLVKQVGWGDNRVIACLLLIVLGISLSGLVYDGWQDKLAPMGMGLALFSLYLTGRVLGKEVFLPLAIGSVIASLGVIAHALLYTGVITGGFVFENNYDIMVGYILLGAALFIHRWQWLVAGLSVIAVLLSGSPEGIFAIAVIGIAVLIRRDWDKRLVVITSLVIILAIAGLAVGLYSYAIGTAVGKEIPPYGYTESKGVSPYEYAENGDASSESNDVNAIEYRIEVIFDALSNIKPLGEGYNLTDFSRSRNVHNVPLVLVQQLGYLGILAGLAWLWISLWCLAKTKWKYVWVLILALSVFDHFIWTQLAPYWWVIIGASTASSIKTDLVFRV